jgi:Domain of unknown function (DUF4328)
MEMLNEPQPATLAGRRPRSIHVLGVLAMAVLGLCCVAQVASAVIFGLRYALLGEWITDSSSVTEDQLAASDLFTTLSAFGELAVNLAAAILFVIWLWRARRNSEAFFVTRHRRHRAWLILGWIVPIVSFWFPKQIVDDIWRTSDKRQPPGTELTFLPRPGLVTAWWTFFLLYMYGTNLVERRFRDAATMDALQEQALAYLLLTPLGFTAAVLAILVVRRITTMQEASLGAQIG